MDKSGAETMPTTTEPPPAPSAFPRENVRRGRNRDHKRRHVRRVEHGETSLPRRGESAAWPTRRPTPEREQGLALRPRGGLPAPWGAAAADPNALAITSEAAASGRRPGAAAVRPRRASRCRARDARNHAAPRFCARRPFPQRQPLRPHPVRSRQLAGSVGAMPSSVPGSASCSPSRGPPWYSAHGGPRTRELRAAARCRAPVTRFSTLPVL
jgi:hypothetical protein